MKRPLASAAVPSLRRHLKSGGIVAYPTESVYGLGCLPRHAGALRRLVRLKKRPNHKGLIVVGGRWRHLSPLLGGVDGAQRQRVTEVWPAAVTFLLPARPLLPPLLRGRGRGKLAVRIPAHVQARALCDRLGGALVSTSCNLAGQRPCRTAAEVRRRFGASVLILPGRCGNSRRASAIVDAQTGCRLR